MNITTNQDTGLCVLSDSDFVLPEIAYFYLSDSGNPYLSIASFFTDCPRVIWQINFLARALRQQAVRRAVFELVGNGISYRVI